MISMQRFQQGGEVGSRDRPLIIPVEETHAVIIPAGNRTEQNELGGGGGGEPARLTDW